MPDKIYLGNLSDVFTALTNVEQTYSSKQSEWETNEFVKSFNDLSGGYLVIKNNGNWVILGIKDNNDVSLGSAPLDSFQVALDKAAELNNWDPRKLIFNEDGILQSL